MKHSLTLLRLAVLLTAAAPGAALAEEHSAAKAPAEPAAGALPVTITEVMKREHPEDRTRDVIVQRIELAPGAEAPPHVHPGMVTGYVISGEFDFQVAGGPLLHLKAGDTFFEEPGSKHMVARNTSATERTVIVAFVVNPKNQATALPMKDH